MRTDYSITQDYLKSILYYNPKTGIFRWKPNNRGNNTGGKIAGHKNKIHGYVEIRITGYGLFRAHRLAWFYVYGVWPDYIDHINLIRHDNILINLRNVSNQVNNQNRKIHHQEGRLLGASFCRKSSNWQSSIYINGKSYGLGKFKTQQEAHDAYMLALELPKYGINDPKDISDIVSGRLEVDQCEV
jgi:hypothetical protein